MEKLKPCPFCGKEMVLISEDDELYYGHPYGNKGMFCYLESLIIYPDQIADWNRRQPLEELLKEYECKEDCEFRYGKECCLGIVHCIRMAEDFYKQKILPKVEEKD